ncbi:Kinetochore-Associated Protein 1 [Manis pentadactyla]|nr:Kinetochore-Associated Protein 1 [Manis pentadactyla]
MQQVDQPRLVEGMRLEKRLLFKQLKTPETWLGRLNDSFFAHSGSQEGDALISVASRRHPCVLVEAEAPVPPEHRIGEIIANVFGVPHRADDKGNDEARLDTRDSWAFRRPRKQPESQECMRQGAVKTNVRVERDGYTTFSSAGAQGIRQWSVTRASASPGRVSGLEFLAKGVLLFQVNYDHFTLGVCDSEGHHSGHLSRSFRT